MRISASVSAIGDEVDGAGSCGVMVASIAATAEGAGEI
jgi:hypothetical protein